MTLVSRYHHATPRHVLIKFSRRWSYLWNIHNPKYNRLRGPKQKSMDQCHCPWHNTHWSALALSTSLLKNLITNGRQPIKVIASEVNIPYRNEYRGVCGGTLKWIMASTLRAHIYYRCSRRCYASSASQLTTNERTHRCGNARKYNSRSTTFQRVISMASNIFTSCCSSTNLLAIYC